MSDQLKAVRAQLDAAKAALDAREKDLARPELNAVDLASIRDAASSVTEEIRALVTRLDAPLEAARERLAQLGGKPKDTEESADVAQERTEREAVVARIDETQRLARSLLVQGDQIIDRVSNRRRESFTRDLLQRSQPLIGPGLWGRVMADVPRDTRSLQGALSDIVLLFSRNGSLGNLLLLGLAFGISVALYFGRRNIAPQHAHRDAAEKAPSRRASLLGAWRVILLGTVPAVAGSYAVYYALDATDLLPSAPAAGGGGDPRRPGLHRLRRGALRRPAQSRNTGLAPRAGQRRGLRAPDPARRRHRHRAHRREVDRGAQFRHLGGPADLGCHPRHRCGSPPP